MEKQNEWLSERVIPPNWWRCSRCLIRVQVKECGYQCPSCKNNCDENRIRHREEVFGNSSVGAVTPTWEVPATSFQPAACVSCNGSGWVHMEGQYQQCGACQKVYQDPYAQGSWDSGMNYSIG